MDNVSGIQELRESIEEKFNTIHVLLKMKSNTLNRLHETINSLGTIENVELQVAVVNAHKAIGRGKEELLLLLDDQDVSSIINELEDEGGMKCAQVKK